MKPALTDLAQAAILIGILTVAGTGLWGFVGYLMEVTGR